MKYLLPLTFVISISNLFLFIDVDHKIGGDAINGKVDNDRYFIANHRHNTEVSAILLTYSEIHSLSLFITFPLGFLAGAGAYPFYGLRD